MTFFQRRHIESQQTHEKMLNLTNHQGEAKQNHNGISSHTCQNGYYKKGNKLTIAGKNVEKRERMCTVGGSANWCSHYVKQHGNASKNKKEHCHMIQQFHSQVFIQRKQKYKKNAKMKRYTHLYVHCSIIYNSQDMDAT